MDGLMYVKKQKEGRDCVKDCYTDTPSTEETETETEVEVKLPQTPVDQLINTLVVDLKVSQELLKQANWSLDSLEGDQPKPLRRLREGPATAPSSGSSRSPLSSPAVGPPSEQYSLSPQRQDWTKNLKVQLQTRDWRLLDHGELDQWLSHYPPETLQNSEQDQLLQIPSQSVQTDQSFKLQVLLIPELRTIRTSTLDQIKHISLVLSFRCFRPADLHLPVLTAPVRTCFLTRN